MGKGKGGVEVFLSDFGLTRIVGTGMVLSRTYKTVADTLGINLSATSNDPQKLNSLNQSFLQNYLFLAPEQKRLDQPVDQKADAYAFGTLTYWLLTGEFPEGIFEMPSKRNPHLQLNWDALIHQCLQANPARRPESLTALLSSTSAPESHFSEYKVPEAELALAGGGALKPVIHSPRLERPTTDLDPGAALIVDTTIKKYVPEKKDTDNIHPLETAMVVIRGGEFWRGSVDGNRDEMPRHKVTLSSYAIDTHPVTNEQFVRFLEAMGGEKDTNRQ